MSSSSLRGHRLGLGAALIALVASTVWVFLPAPESANPTPLGTRSDPAPATDDEPIETQLPDEFPDMVLWTQPPPVVTPPPPPPALRLNAQLLAVRAASADEPAVATLYLVDTAEIVRLRPGDELQGMLVDEITESTVRFSRDERTLVISRDAG
ncbi:MAG: hypothetical protein ACFHWZ_03480 [Phycisphaerales bacterium]